MQRRCRKRLRRLCKRPERSARPGGLTGAGEGGNPTGSRRHSRAAGGKRAPRAGGFVHQRRRRGSSLAARPKIPFFLFFGAAAFQAEEEEEEGEGSGVALGPSGAPMLEVGASRSFGSFWEQTEEPTALRKDRTSTQHPEPTELRLPPGRVAVTMRAAPLFLLCLPALLVQGQYSRFEGITYPEPVQYSQYDQQAEIQDYYDYHDVTPRAPEEQFRYQSQQQSQQEVVPAPTPAAVPETEPTEPGPLDCREEQYPCTRLYSVHKPCKQCLNEICFYSLRRVYVINKEICVRTVCAHEELLRADLCRDKFSKCGVMATSGLCQTVVTSCARSCGGC
ncbi:microfibrillar-associated protein 2 isoform X2 [Dromaius novaehollandiae]|uniref:microfibrillar-associated protein 2 isoform X2 n=1 Tax=Dromaius novaehollandiae TaxID=8790 RepID=UPI00311E70DB